MRFASEAHHYFGIHFARKRCFRDKIQSDEGKRLLGISDHRIVLDARRHSNRIGSVDRIPTTLSGTPPDVAISNSLSPASVSIELRNEPAAHRRKIDGQDNRDPKVIARSSASPHRLAESGRTINR